MNLLAAFKATIVAATIPACIVCASMWPFQMAVAIFVALLVLVVVVLWGVSYENFKRRSTREEKE